MGSFNLTCGVTQQTVAPGDPCYVMAILQCGAFDEVQLQKDGDSRTEHSFASMTCHYDGFWRPVGNFIAATYDDYGQVKIDLEGINYAKVLHLFKQILQRSWNTKQGVNEYHDLPFDFKSFITNSAPRLQELLDGTATDIRAPEYIKAVHACWEYVWAVARKGRLYLSDFVQVARPLEFTVIHATAYHELIEVAGRVKDLNEVPTHPDTYLPYVISKAREAADKLEDEYEKMYAFKDAIQDSIRFADGAARPLWDILTTDLPGFLRKWISGSISDETLLKVLLLQTRDRYALGGYTAMNLRLMPAVTASQDYFNQVGHTYAEFIAKISPGISRNRMVRAYGEFIPYSVEVEDLADVTALSDYLAEMDAALNIHDTASMFSGLFKVEFECTLDEQTLKKVIRDKQLKESSRMLETLQQHKL